MKQAALEGGKEIGALVVPEIDSLSTTARNEGPEGGMGYSTPGRIMIEILPPIRKQIQVIVTRTCDNPEVIDLEEALLRDLVLLWSGVVIRRRSRETPTVTPETIRRKRGGPAGTPEDQKMKIVRGWLKVQGRINQEIYSRSQGVAPSTLRRWIRQLRQEDKL